MADTIFEAFMASAEAAPDNPFLCVPPLPGRAYDPEGSEVSYGAARDQVLALRDAYAAAGYGPGHRVALLLDNRPLHLLHFLALNALGIGMVPINPDYSHDEMLYQMAHSEAALAVVLSHRLDDLKAVAADRDQPLLVAEADDFPGGVPAAPGPASGVAPGRATEAGLFYTSGTTGRPKGCILTNHYFLNAGAWYRSIGGLLEIEEGRERLLNPLPLYHMNAGGVSFCCMLLSRNCIIVPDRFHPTSWWQELLGADATIIHYLGVVPPLLLNMPAVREEKQHRVKFGLGAGIEPELHAAFEARFGFPLVEVWGMTETGRIFADHVEPRQVETRAFGRPFGGLEAKVVDDDDNLVAPGEPGELLVRFAGPDPRDGFFAGYLKNEAATEEAWRGGWFHTGDVVSQAADGMLYFVDRKKNIIRRSGENIAAAEIEAMLQAHDKVAQVAVLAVPDDLRDEEVMACIVPMPGVAPDQDLADELMAWSLEKLAYYKAPGWLLFQDSLPTTGTQKVQKTELFPAGEDPRKRPGIIDFRPRKKRRRPATGTQG